MREEIALSSILGAAVYDNTGALAGHVREVALFPQDDPSRISDFIVKTREGDRLLSSQQVRTVIGSSIQTIGNSLDWPAAYQLGRHAAAGARPADQQIIDVTGRKVVRVNDLDLRVNRSTAR